MKNYSTMVLVGSTSDIGLEILKKIPMNPDSLIIYVGRTRPIDQSVDLKVNNNTKFIECDLTNDMSLNKAVNELTQLIKIDLLVLAAGFLPPENSEFNTNYIKQTLSINSLASIVILSAIANKMSKIGSGDILIISSVASTRPRTRNFTYGSSKAAIEFYATGLASKLYKKGVFISILKPGFVHTKMTKGFKPAPFSLNAKDVSEIAIRGLARRKKIMYAPKKLNFIMNLIKLMPKNLFYIIDKNLN
jgi:decaprenylphospho-beta-D-erythro-pentofuranosid-2-ulose 2-reductase